MAARSIASLTVTFGLVSIPVKLYSATQARAGISFNLIHKDCGSRLRQQYFCIKEDVPVERADMVKGYEFAKDQYVTFSPEELKELEEKGTGTVELMQNRSMAHASGQARAMPARRTGGAGILCGCVTECMAGILSVRAERLHEAVPRRHGVEPACTNFAVGLAVVPRR
jgi:hypothetical protein